MKQTTRIAGLALAVLAATALPFNAALADKGDRYKGDRYKGDRYSHEYKYKKPKYRYDDHYRDHDRHHHHHDKRPVYIVSPPRYGHHHHHRYSPYWPGSTLGFVYDSWTDSWRIGGSYWFD